MEHSFDLDWAAFLEAWGRRIRFECKDRAVEKEEVHTVRLGDFLRDLQRSYEACGVGIYPEDRFRRLAPYIMPLPPALAEDAGKKLAADLERSGYRANWGVLGGDLFLTVRWQR